MIFSIGMGMSWGLLAAALLMIFQARREATG
jgi:hypothetical protein